MAENHYNFVAHLKDGRVIRFNGKCNLVNYTDRNVCIFKNVVEGGTQKTLGAIPFENIEYISNSD